MWTPSDRCKAHKDGQSLRKRGATCSRCGWDGYAVEWPTRADTVAGYNGRSHSARRADVKANQHDSHVAQKPDGDRRDYDVMAASRKMARSAERVAIARVGRQTAQAELLAGLGY